MDTFFTYARKPVVIAVAAIKDDHGPFEEREFAGDANVGGFAFGDDRKLREQTVVIEKEMDFHRALGGSVLGPVEDVGAQVDEGAVQAVELAREFQGRFGRYRQSGSQVGEQSGEQISINLPGPVLIGVGQSGVTRGFFHAEVDEFAFAGLEPFVNLAEALRLPELAKEHGDELVSATNATGMALTVVRFNHPLEQRARNLLEKLTENAGYS